MPAQKRKTGSSKGGTASTKRFTYQSFSQKIANLKIDPIRRVRRHVEDEEEQKSCFRSTLEKWMEMNLSANFTQFTKEVVQLTESLPHILHYQDEIMDALVRYINLRDIYSLEPLLDLLAQFARDLGELFEKHFTRAIILLSAMVTKENDISTIEWTFNCLAYLLKYLSRLLIPDLRPLFGILAPLLGREKQKHFVIRFAAEALSFLLRKSKPEPLAFFIRHVFQDLLAHPNSKQYVQGLSTMFLESCTSVENTVHSKGPALLKFLCDISQEIQSGSSPVFTVVQNVIVGLIHHTQPHTFTVVQNTVYECVQKLVDEDCSASLQVGGILLYTIFTVRKGNRITDWTTGAELLLELLQSVIKTKDEVAAIEIVKASAVLLQTAGMDLVISKGPKIVERIWKYQDGYLFTYFCDIFARLGKERFQQYLLQYFQRFISEQWASHETFLLNLIPKFSADGYLQRTSQISEEELPGAIKWIDAIVLSLQRLDKKLQDNLDHSDQDVMDTEQDGPLELVEIWHKLEVLPSLVPRNKIPANLRTAVSNLIYTVSRYCATTGYQRSYAALCGKCLSISSVLGIEMKDEIWVFLQHALSTTGELLPLLRGATEFLKSHNGSQILLKQDEAVIKALIHILKSSNREARKLSLECLEVIYRMQDSRPSDTIGLALTIENIKPGLDTARSISMYIRQLGSSYAANAQEEWVSRVIPFYLFGLLTSQFAPIMNDTISALSQVAEVNPDIISALALDWLQCKPSRNFDEEKESGRHVSAPLTTFECSNLRAVTQEASQCIKSQSASQASLNNRFANALSSSQIPISTARILALQVLCELPHLAEKNSRQLVPLFLEWAGKDAEEQHDDEYGFPEEELHRGWSKKERASMLTLFSKFVNPKVLHKSGDVYEALLQLIESGDTKVQSLALKCIFTWNSPELRPYAINLENLLDETRFRDELTSFIQVDEQESLIQPNHRGVLIPVLLRILYGRSLSRRNANSGTKGMESRRTVILSSLANFHQNEREMFIDIALGKLLELSFLDKSDGDNYQLHPGFNSHMEVSLRKQLGFIRMTQDMLKQLGSNLLPFVPKILDALLYCLICSGRITKGLDEEEERKGDGDEYGEKSNEKEEKEEKEEEKEEKEEKKEDDQEYNEEGQGKSEGEEDEEEDENEVGGKIEDKSKEKDRRILEVHASTRLAKAIRHGGLRALNGLFASCPSFPWRPYLPFMFDHLFNQRLELLATEVSQSPSGILQIFSTWTHSHETVSFLVNYNSTIIQKLSDCVGNAHTKDEVRCFILKMVQNLVEIAHSKSEEKIQTAKFVQQYIIQPNADYLLSKIAEILHGSLGKNVLDLGIETVSQLAPFVPKGVETTRLVNISVFLLNQPSKRVSPRTKSDILKILRHFLPQCVMQKGDEFFENTFRSICSLFAYFKDRESRETLGIVLSVFTERDESVAEVGTLCQQLNSFSKRRIDEPDFEHRLQAYATINEEKYKHFTTRQWLPLVYNMLYFIKDSEELAIRTNSSYGLRRFVEVCGQKWTSNEKANYFEILGTVVLPALRAGARESSELVRMEYVNVMSHVVKSCSQWEEVSDMQGLLMRDDEEANFFNNILHIQQHRRARALRRLATSAQQDLIQSSNIAHFFLPLIEHFVFDQDGADTHQLAAEAITTIGSLAEYLTWPQFKALFKRYVGYMKTKPDIQKTVIRLIGITVDSLSRVWANSPKNPVQQETNGDVPSLDAEGDTNMDLSSRRDVAAQLPAQDVLAAEITNSFLQVLSEYLHQKDESTVSLRVPVAVSLVKLLKILPEDQLQKRLPSVLTDVCHILRSRAQDSRDVTRKTLMEITTLLGPQYFSFIFKELRGALMRGYQLHVLSFTLHSILVTVIPMYKPGALDYCLPQMMDVIMDDIFGVTGMEKDAEGYISKMKEVKSSKSYDSLELLASTAAITSLTKLVRPIQALLQESLSMKLVKKVDELLRRIGQGLLKNEAVNSRELLIFCYEVVQEGYQATAAAANPEKAVDEQTHRYLVNLKIPNKAVAATKTSSYAYKLIRFALDNLRVVLSKYEHLMVAENLAGFIPIIGDAILSNHEEVRIAGLRLLTSIIRVQLPSIDQGVPVFVKQCINFIKSCPSTNSEIAQASMKLIAAILRERQDATIKDTAIAYVLDRIKPDLEEPDRQGITFNFIKAVLNRKITIPEVYEIIDEIAQIMVTNQTCGVRDMCRRIYVQFLMEYPQGKERLKKQWAFLLKNLDYTHQSGRVSVLECINLLVMKIGDSLIQEVIGTFFVPVMMVLVNDDSTECREMAGALLKTMMEKADSERTTTFLNLARQWLGQREQKMITRLALQLYGLYFDVFEARGKKELEVVTKKLLEILQRVDHEYDDEGEGEGHDWELIYFSLQDWAKIAKIFPEIAFSGEKQPIWQAVHACLTYPHSWIRLSSARLTGLFFAEFAQSPLERTPLENGKGLSFDREAMVTVARRTATQLNSVELTQELALQVVKNLLFLGRCFYANEMVMPNVKANKEEQAEEEAQGSEEGGVQVNGTSRKEQKSALLWLMGKMSWVIRHENSAKKATLGKSSAIKWLGAMTQVVTSDDLVPLAPTMIMPLYSLIDVPEAEQTKELKILAQEALEMVQSRMGVTAYGQVYNRMREVVQERRRERRHKRAIQMVADPERAALKKMKKHEKKKVARKEKAREFRDRRRGM